MSSKELAQMQTTLSTGSFGSYVHWANQIPMLSEKEELDLANRLHKSNDLEAARRMVMSHLRFVVKLARGYQGYGLPMADLVQEGNIGLMKAVKRFDPNKGVRLASFAVHWVRAEMHEFIIKNWRMVKIATTKAQRKLFFNLRKLSKNLGFMSDTETQAIAETLDVPVKDVKQMEMRLSSYDESLDFSTDSDDDYQAPINYLEDHSANPEQALEQSDWSNNQETSLCKALANLDDRARDIVQSRWLAEKKATLHDLASKYNVSAERIRQLEAQAMAKMKTALI